MSPTKKTVKPVIRRRASTGARSDSSVTRGRKSLMISEDVHESLMAMSSKFGTTQPELVEAMLKIVDKSRLAAALAEVSARREREREEVERKRTLMDRALREVDSEALAKFLEQQTGKKA